MRTETRLRIKSGDCQESDDPAKKQTKPNKQTKDMKLKDAFELQALLAADSNYTNPTIWNHGDGYLVETTRFDGAKVTAKMVNGNLTIEVLNQ